MVGGWRGGCWVKRSMPLGLEEEYLKSQLLLHDTYDHIQAMTGPQRLA